MKYDVLWNDELDNLILEVNERLADGWQLCGNTWSEIIEYGPAFNNLMFYQTMIKPPVTIP
jgi:hypothetical protein